MPLLYYLIRWVVSAAALMITAYVVPGFKIKDFSAALIAAVVIGLANIFVWPFLMFVTLPLNLLTLGLFIFRIGTPRPFPTGPHGISGGIRYPTVV